MGVFMELLSEWLNKIDHFVWGWSMIALLVGTGLYLTVRLVFIQIRHLGHAIACVFGKYDKPDEAGDVSHFKALATALSATIGTGNIAGVATAIAAGGPGSVFWMWVTALVGMATKFTSCTLAVKYRVIHADGSASGGPMYYLKYGLKNKKLGAFFGGAFAFFGIVASFGIGNMVQANSVVGGLSYLLPETAQTGGFTLWDGFTVSWLGLIAGLSLSFLTGIVILGGIKRIANVAGIIVPFMCTFYVIGAVIILILHADAIPAAFALIFKYAFTPHAAAGGAIGATIRYGVARGVFSNESGLGSAPIAHAAVKTDEPVREGTVAMLGPFIDTIIICSMTALVILVTGANNETYDGGALTAHAFKTGLFGWGHYLVGIGLAFFAYSTILGWSYYGDRCAEYLFGPKAIPIYRWIFIIAITIGAVGGLRVIWILADISNALMAIPNLIGLILLSGMVVAETQKYMAKLKSGQFKTKPED
ncbi:sodium:alanine symporter family protein [Pontiellaceae bacterium B12219]|nr:sodium:alanine symporter family protein [Pontiellaceae bacterium B12219]